MYYNEYAFGRFEADIETVAKQYDLNLEQLDVEFFSPGKQAIVVETVAGRRFRVHLNLEEHRIISVKQIDGAESADLFVKYKGFMK
jgi:hypothetical protein